MYIDFDGLENELIPQIALTKRQLNSSRELLIGVRLPSELMGGLSAPLERIIDIGNEINNVGYWVQEIIKDYWGVEASNRGVVENNLSTRDFFAPTIMEASVSITEVPSSTDGYTDPLYYSYQLNMPTQAEIKFDERARTMGLEAAIAYQCGVEVANLGMAVVDGALNLVEAAGDAAVIMYTATGTSYLLVIDGVRYLGSCITGEEDFESWTAAAWSNTMGIVEFDWSEQCIDLVYDNYEYLNDAIYITRDGPIYNFTKNLTQDIILKTIPGGTVVSTGVAMAIEFGKSYESICGDFRDDKYSYWNGIEELHKAGEIEDEVYNAMYWVRNASDKEWEFILADAAVGEIKADELDAMKEIRYMPEDWKNIENAMKGLAYASNAAAWKGITTYITKHVAKVKGWSKGTKMAVEAGFNGTKNLEMSAAEALVKGEDFWETYEENGGITSSIRDVAVGLLGTLVSDSTDKLFKWVGENRPLFGFLNDEAFKEVLKFEKTVFSNFLNRVLKNEAAIAEAFVKDMMEG